MTEESDGKELVEHLYNAGMNALRAFRHMMPEFPSGSPALRELRAAQMELLLAAKSAIEHQIKFLEQMEKPKKKEMKKIEVKKK